MGSSPSMLTQYDIQEVEQHCHHLFSQQEIVSLYERFCEIDRKAKGFISADEFFLSLPEFAMNPLSQRLINMVDGLNFKDLVAFLSAFSTKSTLSQKIHFIFKVYDSDSNGKLSFDDLTKVLRQQREEEVTSQKLHEEKKAASLYSRGWLDDFVPIYS